MEIIIDNRELRTKVAQQLYKQGVKLKNKNLEIGDYQIKNIIIERKTIPDLVNSLLDKRLFAQAMNMKQYEKQLLIIEGEENIYTIRNVHPNAIRGALTKITINLGIPTIHTQNETDTAHYLITILKQTPNPYPELIKNKKTLTLNEMKEQLLSTLPGVGRKTAIKILKQNKTIKKFVNQPLEEIKKIKGLGKNAETIYKILNTEYE